MAKIHFHIHWSTSPGLDSQAFRTHAEAEALAKNLVQPKETYAIEEHDSTCDRCAQGRQVRI